MAGIKPKMLSDMAVGERGYCSLNSLYGGPALPVWGHDADVAGISPTTRTFLLDTEVYVDRSPQSTLHIKRLTTGFSVGFPDEAPTVKFRAGHPLAPLPVVGMSTEQDD